MGEYVFTSYCIGGTLPADKIAELEELISQYSDHDDVTECAVLTCGDECNYGNDDEFDAFLIKNGMSFNRTWAAQPGCFGSGVAYWRPGMPQIKEIGCDDDGTPTITLPELRELAKGGAILETVIEALEYVNTLPPFKIAAARPEMTAASCGPVD
jgi:hypothetical protein